MLEIAYILRQNLSSVAFIAMFPAIHTPLGQKLYLFNNKQHCVIYWLVWNAVTSRQGNWSEYHSVKRPWTGSIFKTNFQAEGATIHVWVLVVLGPPSTVCFHPQSEPKRGICFYIEGKCQVPTATPSKKIRIYTYLYATLAFHTGLRFQTWLLITG